MYLATRNFNQGVQLYMDITAGIFLKATGRRKQSERHKYILKSKPILHVTLKHKFCTRGWSSGHISCGTPSPRRGPVRREPSPLSAQGSDCRVTGGQDPLPGHVLGTAQCPAGHSCSWDQQPGLGSGCVPPSLLPSPRLCVGLI